MTYYWSSLPPALSSSLFLLGWIEQWAVPVQRVHYHWSLLHHFPWIGVYFSQETSLWYSFWTIRNFRTVQFLSNYYHEKTCINQCKFYTGLIASIISLFNWNSYPILWLNFERILFAWVISVASAGWMISEQYCSARSIASLSFASPPGAIAI